MGEEVGLPRCPLCGYDVRGLPEPRCPECGHRFEWEELTDPARQVLRWLFEHRRWLGGYLGTAARLAWPWRFWRMLRPGHRVRPARLAAFFLIGWAGALGTFALAVAVVCAVQVQVESQAGRAYMRRSARSLTWGATFVANLPANATMADLQARWANVPTQVYLDNAYPLLGASPLRFYVREVASRARTMRVESELLAFCPLAFAGAASAVLAVMRQSLSRAKLGWRHLFRVVIHSADPLPLMLATLAMGAYCAAQLLRPSGPGAPYVPAMILWAMAAFVVLFALRVEAGVRAYLGLRHAWAVALLSVVMLPLIATALVLPVMGWPF